MSRCRLPSCTGQHTWGEDGEGDQGMLDQGARGRVGVAHCLVSGNLDCGVQLNPFLPTTIPSTPNITS